MNVFTFSGNLGNDCRTGNAGGQSVVNFSVACKAGYGQNEQTNWIDCALWGKRGEALQQYLTKGQQVVVSGELGTREHNGKTYITCKVNEVSLVGGKRDGQQQAPQQRQQEAPQQRQAPIPQAAPIGFDDDIPF
jgi:single-strand DNA-binding protein